MTRGFTQVPNVVLLGESYMPDGDRLSLPARVLFALVLHFSRNGTQPCFVDLETFAGLLELSPRRVQDLFGELKSADLVVRRRRSRCESSETRPLLVVDRKLTSGLDQQPASDKEDAQGEEDNNGADGQPQALVSPKRSHLSEAEAPL